MRAATLPGLIDGYTSCFTPRRQIKLTLLPYTTALVAEAKDAMGSTLPRRSGTSCTAMHGILYHR
jgi:hypothetical protein